MGPEPTARPAAGFLGLSASHRCGEGGEGWREVTFGVVRKLEDFIKVALELTHPFLTTVFQAM